MPLRIIFMGTPDFATPSLSILLDHGYELVGVVTAADKLGGRGKNQLIQSAVKRFATEHGLNILQPDRLRSPEFLAELEALKADLQVVVAFRMLPQVVWAMPPLGTFNLHGSLLPKYRGAAPINWAIINGETETGVSSFFLQEEIDTGDLIFQERLPIGPDETAGELHDRMMHLGAQVVLRTVQAIERGDVQPRKQDDTLASKAPKIFHETCQINFHQSVHQIHNFIRGLSPYPAAWTTLDGKVVKIFRSRPQVSDPLAAEPGHWSTDGKNNLYISAADGRIEILELQLEGRKRLSAVEFLRGFSHLI